MSTSARYDVAATEAKWQKIWDDQQSFRAENNSSKPKYFALIEFPYPSGEGLHVGHPRSYTALDVVARKRRMEGFNVLYAIGWDAFGLPTENFAIKTGQHPRDVTKRNVSNFRRQLKSLGFAFDWSREIDTTDPSYYKWTQWIFLKLWEKGLAYKTQMPINWCPSCKVGLANEEVVNGACERCGTPVEQRLRKQWMLRITAYADRLLSDLDHVDYLEKIKAQQRNWIGKSEGARIKFKIVDRTTEASDIEVFTTRPDTLFGASFIAISPQHPMAIKLAETNAKLAAFIDECNRTGTSEAAIETAEKKGCDTGIKVAHPFDSGWSLPVYVANFVLMGYGTGAVFGCPAHDQRDLDFARKYTLSVVPVVLPPDAQAKTFEIGTEAYTGPGTLYNSNFLDGLDVAAAKQQALQRLELCDAGSGTVQFHLRDWVFSRQRYWGEPIPIVECPHCGMVPLPENSLPLLLPDVEHYQTSDTGESPLSLMTDWVNTTCPTCGGPAKRETDTMPQWAGSSWYFLRYCDPHNDKALADPKALDYWMPVDWYNGGMEHTTLHLLYSRFWHKFLFDIGVVSMPEPYAKRTSHGLILGENGEKMSKSRGNVVNPDEVVTTWGADAVRLYEMFMGPFELPIPWSTNGLVGVSRFLHRVWALQERVSKDSAPEETTTRAIHRAMQDVNERIELMKFNTALSALMELSNHFYELEKIALPVWEDFLKLLVPFAPHLAEELWQQQGHADLLSHQPWPKADPALLVETTAVVAVQVNGKLRATLTLPLDMESKAAEAAALADANVQRALEGKTAKKIIVVPNKIVNIVAG